MENRCNFKIERFGKLMHVHSLEVACRRDSKGIYYAVKGYANENTVSIAPNSSRHTELFDTVEEAFAFLDKIVAKYPQYGDDRDLDIALAPLYEGVEDEPIRTKVCKKEKEPAPNGIGTSSKENNHNTSITDNSENVNTSEKIPEIVLEALTNTLEDLYGHKREMERLQDWISKQNTAKKFPVMPAGCTPTKLSAENGMLFERDKTNTTGLYQIQFKLCYIKSGG